MSLLDDIPTYVSLRNAILAIWQSERPNADDGKYSDLWLYSRITARLVYRLHQTFVQGVHAILPQNAQDTYLDKWLEWVGASDGEGGYGLIHERGSGPTDDALTVTASGATADLDGQQLRHTNGTIYELDESYAFGGAGSYNFQVVAISTGLETNRLTGDTLSFISTPANVSDVATFVKDMSPLGADAETNPEGQARLLRRLQRPAASGNVSDWVEAVEAVSPGNLKCFVWPKRELQPYGYGRTDYCALLINETQADRHIGSSDDIYTDISDAVEDELPVLLVRNSRELTISSVALDCDITITLADDATDDQKCDWDAEGNKRTVASHDAGGVPNKEIVASGNITSPTVTNGIAADDIVVIGGIAATVASVVNATTFRLSTWPYATGAGALNGLNICSGGGLIGEITQGDTTGSGIMQTLQDHFDSLGPAKGTYAAGAQIGDWDDTARVLHIQSEVIQFGDGAIADVTVDDLNGGVVDVSPTAGSGATTERLVWDELTVWQEFV